MDDYPETLLEDLPGHLSERTRVLNRNPVFKGGSFVLYWMHHAVRGHENPALDVSLWAADRLKLPVLVYQGLGGRHAYNSDRHHRFILEGARDVEKELKLRKIPYFFHLPETPEAPTPLRELVAKAALALTEEFPVPPFKNWTRRLAAIAPGSFWTVDAACILPMQLVGKPYDRAFRFRKATWRSYQERMSQPYPELNVDARPLPVPIGFSPVDLAAVDIAECCAKCRIDHAVGPVAHTRGGSAAGYERWKQFEQDGLRKYAKNRNDAAIPFPSGVSRMSAYLHHGHVSPFRIVRRAALSNAEGAQKFLDEILIWRELAHNFCFHNDHPETLDALPAWAKQTLERHRQDPRKPFFSWETLARGRTGDPLWDAAQKSLLIHGELHNNVRMTWGKAILQWTRTPEEALRTMIDLNHRFALDGSDPNSYAGILWCMGLFDRPFQPEKAIIGSIRPRSTRSHASRLNLSQYTDQASKPASGAPIRAAIIGAGVSGLAASRILADHGHHVSVFEKARGPGGRLSTRRTESGAFDHGAQYFTVRDERFKRWVDSWREAGIVRSWEGRIGVLCDGSFQKENCRHERFVGVPGMSSLSRRLSEGLDIRLETRIERVQKDDNAIVLIDQKNEAAGPFDALIVTAPPEQSVQLFENLTPEASRLNEVKMTPCWAVMLTFAKPLDLPFDGAFVHKADISWAARNSSKPGRGTEECWVLHAAADWSANHLGSSPEDVVSRLLECFENAVGVDLPDPSFSAAHRWRYAQARNPLDAGCIWDPRAMIGLCGDWCHGSRIEGAFLSGAAMAGRILSYITSPHKNDGPS